MYLNAPSLTDCSQKQRDVNADAVTSEHRFLINDMIIVVQTLSSSVAGRLTDLLFKQKVHLRLVGVKFGLCVETLLPLFLDAV